MLNLANAHVFQFPGSQGHKPKILPEHETTSLDGRKTQSLLNLCATLKGNVKQLVDFMDSNRDAARQAGIESIAIEMNTILEGGRFDRIHGALQEAALEGVPAEITIEGLDKVHRLERLVAEAGSNLNRFIGAPLPNFEKPQAPVDRQIPFLNEKGGRMAGPADSGSALWLPIVFLGTCALLAFAIVVLKKN